MHITIGTQLGAYEITGMIGKGGMGEVYKAHDMRLNRTVAIKVLPEHSYNDPELKQRLEREAQMIAALTHPHICAFYDARRYQTFTDVIDHLKPIGELLPIPLYGTDGTASQKFKFGGFPQN